MTYLYIFEDGRVAVHNVKPTLVDLECIDNGTLQVFQIPVGQPREIDADGKVGKIPECKLVTLGKESWHE